MKADNYTNKFMTVLTLLLIVMPMQSTAYESGSTGADGEFTMSQSTTLPLPPDGVFNFTNVTITSGTLRFNKNANNTPVTILASGDVTINGSINISGTDGGNQGNDFTGKGGVGGFDGGRGGFTDQIVISEGGDGQGPGRGTGARRGQAKGGGGGSFATAGGKAEQTGTQGMPGPTYGSAELLPLIGGSGGGGGAGGVSFFVGSAGGGGGGAILIAASGTITINGAIRSNGGNGGTVGCCSSAGRGASGSGGAIRLVATTIQGEGIISAVGGTIGAAGGSGRIRLETENLLRATNTTPTYSFTNRPRPLFLSNIPSIRITSVGGIAAPTNPTGDKDIVLPGFSTNPVTVELETINVPLGSTITLTAAPVRGTARVATSTPVAGSMTAGTATASISLANGNSIMTAQTSFTVTASLGMDYSRYAQGEPVKEVVVAMNDKGQSETTFISKSGKKYTWPSNTLAMN